MDATNGKPTPLILKPGQYTEEELADLLKDGGMFFYRSEELDPVRITCTACGRDY